MLEIAHRRGIAGFTADVLGSNVPMLRVFHRSGHDVTSASDGTGVYHLTVHFRTERLDAQATGPTSEAIESRRG